MKLALLFLISTLLNLSVFADVEFPTCSEAKNSPKKNDILVQIVTEEGKIKVQSQAILEKAKQLVDQIRSGAVDRSTGLQQLNEYKETARELSARDRQLDSLFNCIIGK